MIQEEKVKGRGRGSENPITYVGQMIIRFLSEAPRRGRFTAVGAGRLRTGHLGREPDLKGDELQTTEAGVESSQFLGKDNPNPPSCMKRSQH